MTNPYNVNNYSQMQNGYYDPSLVQPKQSGAPILGLATLGFIGGGTMGYFKNRYPVDKNGVVSDTFAKNAFENHVKKNFTDENKKIYEQTKKFIKKVDSISCVEDFKKFLKSNKELTESCAKGVNTSVDDYIESMTSSNFKNIKNSLKEYFQKQNNMNIEKFKTFTEKSWDKESKKFVKESGISDKILNILKNTTSNHQWKKTFKYGGIGAGICGALAIGYNLLMGNNNRI